jgi:hypothetical protein
MPYVTVSEAAFELESTYKTPCKPRDISDLIYERRIDVNKCPMQSGRRLIPRELLPTIANLLRRSTRSLG